MGNVGLHYRYSNCIEIFPKSYTERVTFLIRQLTLLPFGSADRPRGLFGRKEMAGTDLAEFGFVGESVHEVEI
jgi:hypothetical protein